MGQRIEWKSVLLDQCRFLIFRARMEDYDRYGKAHLLLGLTITWLVGIARNWDYPDAPVFATLGLGSLVYVVFLAALLFAFAYPLSEERRSYVQVMTVVTMTAAPGLIYGIPVERFLSLEEAQETNVWFLTCVAIWRVALTVHFFILGCGISFGRSLAAILTPICGIIIGLVGTGRAGVVLDVMGGFRESMPDDRANMILGMLYCLAWPTLLLGILVYIGALMQGRSAE